MIRLDLSIGALIFVGLSGLSHGQSCGDASTAHPVDIHLKVELKTTDLIDLLQRDDIAELEAETCELIAEKLSPNADFVFPWKITSLAADAPNVYPMIHLTVTDEVNSNRVTDNWKMSVVIQGTEKDLSKKQLGETSVLDSTLLATNIQFQKIPQQVADKFQQRFISRDFLEDTWTLFPVTQGYVSKNKIAFSDPTRAGNLTEHQTLLLVSPHCYLDYFRQITTSFELRCQTDGGVSIPFACTATTASETAVVDAVSKVCLVVNFENEQRQPVAGSTANVFFDMDSIDTNGDSSPPPSGGFEIGEIE